MARLEARGLCKAYRRRRAVDEVSLHARDAEVVGLLGPNGAGKTTCFYLLAGLMACDRGRVELDGRDVTGLPMSRRARLGIGYLPQEPSVFRRLSVADNIRGVLEQRPLDRAARAARLEQLLAEFSIAPLRDSRGYALSGGERRRVEIARALAGDPAFLLLDEPFAGIDPLHVADIKAIIGHLRGRGLGIIITDHNVRETLSVCDRAYILSDGRVIAEGAPAAILADPQVRATYLGEDFRL